MGNAARGPLTSLPDRRDSRVYCDVEVSTVFRRRLAATWVDSFVVYDIAVFVVSVAFVASCDRATTQPRQETPCS